MKKGGILILALFLFLTEAWADLSYPWELKRDLEGIQVSTRPVKDSPILEFQAETVIHAPLEKVIPLFEDTGRMTEWFYKCKEAQLLKQESADEANVYFAADLPWPFADRDGVYRRVKMTADGAVVYKLEAASGTYPRQKGRVRVTYLDSEWRFTPRSDGVTAVYYRIHTAAGGFIPPGVINRFTVSLPFKTLRKFRALLEE
ncbi:MAG TPA: START domain-containing protein [Verrucomicrobiae bacterium]|jgi:hypothetical protein|nr:START domain-containing protein [Verrucomicrobiae bacterium]